MLSLKNLISKKILNRKLSKYYLANFIMISYYNSASL